ncbi:MAG: heteromeric transposase endonuclease subunit TnsA [Anaerolineae bacterium]|nr:heteromeric transposase endonuclease subunit TnsA [Anaerolineae bacterium]
MAKRNRATDQTVIDRRIQEGRGQGRGAEYKPWLTIQDVASQGLVTREKGWKTTRVHQMLSKLELAYFYVLEWAPFVSDIREQYPLLNIEETLAIAQEIGVRHPTDPQTQQPVVMTTDFLVTVRSGTLATDYARTLKYAQDLQSRRTLEKFEIERRYWQTRNVDWGIVTEHEIPMVLAKNVELLHEYRHIADRASLPEDEYQAVADRLTRQALQTDTPLKRIALDCDRHFGLAPGTGLTVAYHLMANRRWQINMEEPLTVSKRLAILSVTDLDVE